MSDPTILSWGAGVNICEDLRRSIRTEIEDGIDPSIMNLQGNVKNEDRTSTQLAKDLHHARAEMLELRRSADDELDGAKMKDQVRTRLKATLKAELMTPMMDVNSASPPDLSDEGEKLDGRPPSTISAYLKQRVSELKERASTVEAERESLLQVKGAKDDLEDETQSLLGRIESDRLVDQVAAEKKEVTFHSEEFENEARRKRSTKDAVQQKRAECGQHAQQIADHVSTVYRIQYM
jgi:predicted  nucleic acid-binding Zn-ribbon protein